MRRSQRHALLKLIAEEILAGRDPMGIREDHGINYHTWARWVRTVRQNPEVLLETPTPETATKKSVEAPKLPLPGALAESRVANRALASTRPEPATVASPSPTEPIDVMAQAHRMLKVCDELDRAGRDEGGQIRIEGGPTVNDALKRRRETIETLARIREDCGRSPASKRYTA